jgi:hypothetical protein
MITDPIKGIVMVHILIRMKDILMIMGTIMVMVTRMVMVTDIRMVMMGMIMGTHTGSGSLNMDFKSDFFAI